MRCKFTPRSKVYWAAGILSVTLLVVAYVAYEYVHQPLVACQPSLPLHSCTKFLGDPVGSFHDSQTGLDVQNWRELNRLRYLSSVVIVSQDGNIVEVVYPDSEAGDEAMTKYFGAQWRSKLNPRRSR